MSPFDACNFSVLKNSQVQFNSKLNEKKIGTITYQKSKIRPLAQVPEDLSLYLTPTFFRILENYFQNFRTKFSPLFCVISLT